MSISLLIDSLALLTQLTLLTQVRFMNIDCDLYSSTKDILDVLHARVVVGTVIVFDE